MPLDNAYDLYRNGEQLLNDGHPTEAIEPLTEARKLEPAAGMVREALGRAFLKAGRFREAAEEFHVLVGWEPVNDYALFCYGRALQLSGDHAEARAPLTLAALLNPDRHDYQVYRDKTVAAMARRKQRLDTSRSNCNRFPPLSDAA